VDAVAEAKQRYARRSWREDDLNSLGIRYAELLLRIADHRVAMRHQGTAADRRLWDVLDEEAF